MDINNPEQQWQVHIEMWTKRLRGMHTRLRSEFHAVHRNTHAGLIDACSPTGGLPLECFHPESQLLVVRSGLDRTLRVFASYLGSEDQNLRANIASFCVVDSSDKTANTPCTMYPCFGCRLHQHLRLRTTITKKQIKKLELYREMT